jgi:hypothetical protein
MAKTIMQLLKDVGCVQKNIEVTEDLFVLEFRTP